MTRSPPHLESVFPVEEVAGAAVTASLLAAAELSVARRGRIKELATSSGHIAAAIRSEHHVRLAGARPGLPLDSVSGFARAADGWVRLHGTYPHHLAALGGALECAEPTRESLHEAVSRQPALLVEDAVTRAGGCTVAVRETGVWNEHPQGRWLAGRGLLDFELADIQSVGLSAARPDGLPGEGLRVLDLTRVIAGPIASRFLTALGCDVLRVDPPGMPEIPLLAVDTGVGKRNTCLDLRTAEGRSALWGLLDGADVVVQGYRGGALAALGFGPEEVRRACPQLTTVDLTAWGHGGPWGQRRGFDSLVQAASGIARVCEPRPDLEPGVLPAQLLDHATGYLIAAAALRGLASRARDGRPAHARLALARTAHWVLGMERGASAFDSGNGAGALSYLVTLPSEEGDLVVVAPPGAIDGTPLRWPHSHRPPCSSPSAWLPR